MSFLSQTENINFFVSFSKIYCISIYIYYIAFKIMNETLKNKKGVIFNFLIIAIVALIHLKIKSISNLFYSIIFLIFILSIMIAVVTKRNIGYSICVTTISASIGFILFFFAVSISFLPNAILGIKNNFIGLVILIIIYAILIYMFLKIKRFKKGFIFLQKRIGNEYFDILILNMSVIILFAVIILSNYDKVLTRRLFIGFIIFSIIMFVTIQKSLQLYYKQKLLIQDLEETKKELENKKQEIEELEKENLNFSKTSHSLAHKQKSLEYKINQLLTNSETASEIDIRDRVNNLSKEIYKEAETVQLSKTEIPEIDDMLEYMQSECIKNKIEFELQINGNIHYMVNNLISKKDLEILIADHIKNAIIAINHSNNINRSILVKIGKIDNIYSLYIYDSGIEFEKETLSKLGKEPSTTYREEGGTGMGFMNTFDTLEKYEASLIINEYNKPSPDNYTKSIVIKFDKNKEFKIKSYRE